MSRIMFAEAREGIRDALRPGRAAVLGIAVLGVVLGVLADPPAGSAYPSMNYASDLITDSAISSSTNHTITFQVPRAVPPLGRIIITPDAGAFTIPTTTDFGDVDLGTAGSFGGPFAERTLAVAASAVADGVAVVTGESGSVTITLNSSTGLSTSTFVRVKIGTHATFGGTGDDQIVNPSSTASYHIRIRTEDASGAVLNEDGPVVAILPRVFLYSDTLDFDPPIIANGLPTGTIPAGIRQVEITVTTDEPAYCRYATTPGIDYDFMPYSFTGSLVTLHLALVSTTVDGTTYTFYVRCVDRIPNKNPDDYLITFAVGSPLPPPGASGPAPAPPGASGPPYPPPPAIQAQITFDGIAYPGALVSILKDAVAFKEGSAAQTGRFDIQGGELAQGTYTFAVSARDASGRRSAPYATTFTIVYGTRNALSGIIVPPTIALENSTVEPGATARILGSAAPFSRVELRSVPSGSGAAGNKNPVLQSTTSTASGAWTADLDTGTLATGIYDVKARTVVPGAGTSPFSQAVYLGVGRTPRGDTCERSDINRDSKVNLVDFSILLFHWGSADPLADLNIDGRVNLTDFSIMLFCWTG